MMEYSISVRYLPTLSKQYFYTIEGILYEARDTKVEGGYIAKEGIEPTVYEQSMRHSIRMAQKIYRTTNDSDLQGIREVRPLSISKDLASILIGKLGLSPEEALMRP